MMSTAQSIGGTVFLPSLTTSSAQRNSNKLYATRSVKDVVEAMDNVKTTEEIWGELRELCVRFVFPDGMPTVPNALVTMTVYAKYGPAVEDPNTGELRIRGTQRLLMHHETQLLKKEEQRAFEVEVFTAKRLHPVGLQSKTKSGESQPIAKSVGSVVAANISAMSLHDEVYGNEILGQKHPLMETALQLTKGELLSILNSCKYPAHDSNDAKARRSTLADAMSNALLAERERRIMMLKKSDAQLKEIRSDEMVTNRKATTIYNKTATKAFKIDSFEKPHHVQRALHRYATLVCDGSNSKSAEIAANVRCLRAEYEAPPGEVKEGWDGYCCLRGKGNGKASTLRY